MLKMFLTLLICIPLIIVQGMYSNVLYFHRIITNKKIDSLSIERNNLETKGKNQDTILIIEQQDKSKTTIDWFSRYNDSVKSFKIPDGATLNTSSYTHLFIKIPLIDDTTISNDYYRRIMLRK